MPLPLTPYQAAIVRNCAVAVQTALQDFSLSRVLFFDDCIVKFNQVDILNEGDTQAFVYTASKSSSSPNTPRVPEVYDCFSWDHVQYLVMERIYLPTVETWINGAATSESETEEAAQSRFEVACQAVAHALQWLFALSPPVGAEIGLIEGAYAQTQSIDPRARNGCANHPFFGTEGVALLRYTSALALERHINKALSVHRPRSAPPLSVEISNEPLVMVQGDITPRNFLIDPKTLQVTIIDFGAVSALPRSFVSFTLYSKRCDFIVGINKFLGWERADNSRAMSAAALLYYQVFDMQFGLDKDGNPVEEAISRRRPPKSKPPVYSIEVE